MAAITKVVVPNLLTAYYDSSEPFLFVCLGHCCRGSQNVYTRIIWMDGCLRFIVEAICSSGPIRPPTLSLSSLSPDWASRTFNAPLASSDDDFIPILLRNLEIFLGLDYSTLFNNRIWIKIDYFMLKIRSCEILETNIHASPFRIKGRDVNLNKLKILKLLCEVLIIKNQPFLS